MGASNSKLQICSFCRASIPPNVPDPNHGSIKEEIATTDSNSEAVLHDTSDDEEDTANSQSLTVDLSKHLPPSTVLCVRCHALNRTAASKSSGKIPADAYKRYIEHLQIAPFVDTLESAEEKELESEYLIKRYLVPYFKENDTLLIRTPYRLNIKGVEFKVIGAYPPKGFVSGDITTFHVTASDDALNLLTFEPLKEIHCLPTAASLETYHAIHGIVPDEDDEDHSNQDLHRVSLRPYLMGNDKLFYVDSSKHSADNKVDDGTLPTSDALDDDGLKSESTENADSKESNQSIQCIESKQSTESTKSSMIYVSDQTLFGDQGHRVKRTETESDAQNLKEDQKEIENMECAESEDTKRESAPDLSNKSLRRHLCCGETFVSFGIQWRVMRCVPSNGYISSKTKVFYKGKPLRDCAKVTMRPIYETVPFSHRNFTPKQYKLHYLDSWSHGVSRYIGHSREVRINGVDFAIRDSEPNAGLVTMQTAIDYMGMAIKLQQLQAIRAMEDEEMAKQLVKQMEEERQRKLARARRQRHRGRIGRDGIIRRGNGNENGNGDGGGGGLRGRWEDPLAFDFPSFEFPWSRPAPPPKKKRGVDQALVERLPTFEFGENHKADQCRICLEYYNPGEELRMLPCFHRYHKGCVDTWLTRMSAKCPICKTSIVKRTTRPR